MQYRARAPLRIDFAGGWTDVPLYAEREGGAVLNAAITRYVEGQISRPEGSGLLRAMRSDRSYVSYSLDLPSGAGLGASAAQTVLWTTLVKTTIANVSERAEIAEIAWKISNLLGVLGGKQDEYASALGGINYLTFGSEVTADRLTLPAPIVDSLRARLVLAYSGETRLSADVHASVWRRYLAGETRVADALGRLRDNATAMHVALLSGDLDTFAGLIGENWNYQKALDAAITTPAIESLLATARIHGAVAGKACGAGGGGCVLLVAAPGRAGELDSGIRSAGVRVIDFDFDTYGVYLRKG